MRRRDAHVHGAGQIGLLAAVALFGVDYFTSYFYATGEMMSALHPYGLQKYAYIAVAVIALANFVFGALYMYSLGIFNEGGGSYTASMRYLTPSLSLIVAVVLIEDYTLDHRRLGPLRRRPAAVDPQPLRHNWVWHFMLGAALAFITWYLTIRGRGGFVLRHVPAAGCLRAADRDHGGRAVPGPQPRRACRRRSRSSSTPRSSQAAVPHADGLDEGHGRLERAGGDVERHPVLSSTRTLRLVRWGKKHLPRLQALVELLQRQVGHRPCRPDLLPVLRGLDDALPDLLLDPLQRLRRHPRPHPGRQLGVHRLHPDPRAGPSCSGSTRSWRWLCWRRPR